MFYIFVLNVKFGEIVWKFDSVGSVYGLFVFLFGGWIVFFVLLDYNIYVFDCEIGKLYWLCDMGFEVEFFLVVSKLDGMLYVGLIKD